MNKKYSNIFIPKEFHWRVKQNNVSSLVTALGYRGKGVPLPSSGPNWLELSKAAVFN